MKLKLGTIYAIVNLLNGRMYIGQTTQSAKERYEKHVSACRCGVSHKLYSAIRQFGEQNFEIRILQTNVPLDILSYTEMYYIAKYKAVSDGYNVDDGNGSAKREHCLSQEHRSLVTQRNLDWHKNNPEKSAAIIEKMNAARLAKGTSEETRKKLSEARKGNQYKKGKKQPPMSQESKDKLSAQRKGKKRSEASKLAMRAGWAARKARIAAFKKNMFNN